MASPAPEKEKKKAALASAAQKPAMSGGAPEVAKDKAEIGAMLRPGAEAGALEVGAKSDKAEAEADKVADAVLKDAPAEPEAAGKKDGEKTKDEKEDPARSHAKARAPPSLALVINNTYDTDAPIRRTSAQGGQPHLDSLSSAPAVPGNMSEVSVAANEESQLDELTDSDYSVLSQGEGLQPKLLDGVAQANRFAVATPLAERIRSVRGGSVVPDGLRGRIEDRLGVDLSSVRIHTGSEPAKLCAAIGAKAFAHRGNIWLRSPAELSDARLVTHEVVHTIQQGAAPRCGRQRSQKRSRANERPETRTRRARAPPDPQAPNITCTGKVQRLFGDGPGLLARGAERLADRLDSYGVLKVLIGRRLFTGETINPSATDFVGAFMKFIGAEETFEQMKQSGSLERGFSAIREGLTTYDITWDRVRRTFARARDDFDWLSPIDSFVDIFGPFFRDVVSYGVLVLKVVAELVAEAFVIGFGPIGREVWEKIKRIGDTINLIVENPLQFAMNLIRAVARGIQGFGTRIWEHIKAGLLAWVLGPLTSMGIQLPQQLDLKGIVSLSCRSWG